jgi:hypothetical protein
MPNGFWANMLVGLLHAVHDQLCNNTKKFLSIASLVIHWPLRKDKNEDSF